jgi:hypothetical protein
MLEVGFVPKCNHQFFGVELNSIYGTSKKDNVILASSFEYKCRMRNFLFDRRMKIGGCDLHHVGEKAWFPSQFKYMELRSQ